MVHEEKFSMEPTCPGRRLGFANHRWETRVYFDSSGFQEHKATWTRWRRSQYARQKAN